MHLPERVRRLSPDAEHRWRLAGLGLLVVAGVTIQVSVEEWPQSWLPLYAGTLGLSAVPVAGRALPLVRVLRGSGRHLGAHPTEEQPMNSFALLVVLVLIVPLGAPVIVLASFACWIAFCMMSMAEEGIHIRREQARVQAE